MTPTSRQYAAACAAAAQWFKDHPQNWTRGTMARDEDGRQVHHTDRRATCFCAIGRVLVELPGSPPSKSEFVHPIDLMHRREYGVSLMRFNDWEYPTVGKVIDHLFRLSALFTTKADKTHEPELAA